MRFERSLPGFAGLREVASDTNDRRGFGSSSTFLINIMETANEGDVVTTASVG